MSANDNDFLVGLKAEFEPTETNLGNDFLAGLKAEFEPIKNTNDLNSSSNLSPFILLSIFIVLLLFIGKRSISNMALNNLPIQNKKRIVISFFVGIIVGAASVYALANRYVSYPSFKWRIVRIDKFTGKTEVADVRRPNLGWTEVGEK